MTKLHFTTYKVLFATTMHHIKPYIQKSQSLNTFLIENIANKHAHIIVCQNKILIYIEMI